MKESKYVKIHSVNPLYFVADQADSFIEQKVNRYLKQIIKFCFYIAT